jgi:outer membrane protein W
MRSTGIFAVVSLGFGAALLPHTVLADNSGSEGSLRRIEIRARDVFFSARSPVSSQFYPELSAELFITRDWSTEVAIGHSSFTAYCCDIDRSFEVRPLIWTVKYNFLPGQVVDPYLGFGFHHTDIIGPAHTHFSLFLYPGVSNGPAAQAGFDVRPSRSLALNVDVRYLASLDTGRFHADPFLISVGIAYRFGDFSTR